MSTSVSERHRSVVQSTSFEGPSTTRQTSENFPVSDLFATLTHCRVCSSPPGIRRAAVVRRVEAVACRTAIGGEQRVEIVDRRSRTSVARGPARGTITPVRDRGCAPTDGVGADDRERTGGPLAASPCAHVRARRRRRRRLPGAARRRERAGTRRAPPRSCAEVGPLRMARDDERLDSHRERHGSFGASPRDRFVSERRCRRPHFDASRTSRVRAPVSAGDTP